MKALFVYSTSLVRRWGTRAFRFNDDSDDGAGGDGNKVELEIEPRKKAGCCNRFLPVRLNAPQFRGQNYQFQHMISVGAWYSLLPAKLCFSGM